MIKVTLPDNTIVEIAKGGTLLDLAQKEGAVRGVTVLAAIYNGLLVDLRRPGEEAGSVLWIDANSEDGMRVYTRTLLFMMIEAAAELMPDLDIEVRNTMGSALFCRASHNGVRRPLASDEVAKLEARMREMVDAKLPITYKVLTKHETAELAKEANHITPEIGHLVHFLPDDIKLKVYYLNNMPGFFFDGFVPDCGYVPYFELLPYEDGIMINYPDIGTWDVLPPFHDQPIMHEAYEEMEEWAKMIHCDTIGKLNTIIDAGYEDKIIQVAEALHEKKLSRIADKVAERKRDIKIILIAGPSSSGKTSTAQRLSIQLAVNGLRPMPISMDDYYRNREDTPRRPDGGYDFECLEAIDVPLFNEQLQKLLAGEAVELPKYNFKTGMREYNGNVIQMDERSVLVIEGIHGLNEKLTASIPAKNKMKLYVSALTPMSLDAYNRIHTTDVRLLRRMVRDSQFRNYSAEKTLDMWMNVREGEEKYIFPFQSDADVVFNTTLVYELAVLKKYAVPLLQEVPQSNANAYSRARRLLHLLKYVKEVNDNIIPNNSILREFFGGSVFKEVQ